LADVAGQPFPRGVTAQGAAPGIRNPAKGIRYIGMSTIYRTRTQLSLFGAMAALLAVMLAVTLAAGPAQAQGLTPVDPRTGDNEDFYDEPYPCSEEAQPDDDTASVISEGYYAVFDAFWDYEAGRLSDNFCPPEVTETTEYDPATESVVTVTTRSDTNIHISETAFSIPDSYKVTVVDSAEINGNPSTASEPRIDLSDYPFLRQAVSAVEPGPDSTAENPTTVFADNSVWWVRLDQPWTTADETSPLKIGFSTALMKEGDWHSPDGLPVQFQFGAVRVIEPGIPQKVHVMGADFFAFDQREAHDTILTRASWSNIETATEGTIDMAVDEYRPMQFLFTKPGEYLVQARIRAHVRRGPPAGSRPDWTPINPGDSITGPTEGYTFHVGPVADVGVTLTHTDETPGDGATTVTDGTASFSVTATNHGPQPARNVMVKVNLPVGLDLVATDPGQTGVTYECGVISWRVGDLNNGLSQTLDFTSSVGAGVPRSLTADAEVHGSTVDHIEANDSVSVEVLSSSTVVWPPFFPGVSRDIVEHAFAGTHAGDPVAANNPDGRELTYTLWGRCSHWFQAHSNGQIVLASGRTLDYDEQSEFRLTLHVSDGVNASGAADASADDSIPVTIRVIDTPDDAVHPAVTFSLGNGDPGGYPDLDLSNPVAGSTVAITPGVQNLPAGVQPNDFLWTNSLGGREEFRGADGLVWASAPSAGAITYTVQIQWSGGGITSSYTINWVAPPSQG